MSWRHRSGRPFTLVLKPATVSQVNVPQSFSVFLSILVWSKTLMALRKPFPFSSDSGWRLALGVAVRLMTISEPSAVPGPTAT